MQGGTRRKDSYIGHPLPFLWHEGSPGVTGYFRKVRKVDRLSKRYFRVCSWNCASANRRGAVLEKMIYDFDVVCLQETRTCPNRPLVLQGFRGMAIAVRSNLSKTVSLLNLDKWSTSARELQGIRIEKPDERHKSLILINAYIHPSTCITGASWDFFERWKTNWEAQL